MGKGARAGPDPNEVRRVVQWLKLADEAKAWDWLVGRRIQALREARRERARAASLAFVPTGRARAPESPQQFSQLELARRLGFSQSWLAKIERGNRALTIFEAHHIAAGLEVDASLIVGPPTAEERNGMDAVVRDVQRARTRQGVTATQLAAEREDARNGRLRASLRSPRETQRVRAVRAAIGDADE
ncbi:MAG: helix-turn-helix transcriptional regulator [Gemmatimonadaceae bacterium]|nr:helix-turn-helix transcriptional regulator [Gemmatimonadaceae bacterium]